MAAKKTLTRKLKNCSLPLQLGHHLSKNEILELYLNKVYFGDGLYGVEAAARGYFGKKASELSVPEAALLAGLLKAPSSYAPTVSAEKAEARQSVVLKAMLDTKAITRDEYDLALKTVVEIYDGLRAAEPYGRYFKEDVRRQLVERFGAERVSQGGLQVYTTINLEMQRAAEAAVEQGLLAIEKTLPKRPSTSLRAGKNAAPRSPCGGARGDRSDQWPCARDGRRARLRQGSQPGRAGETSARVRRSSRLCIAADREAVSVG